MSAGGRPRERPGPEPPPGPDRGAEPAAPGAASDRDFLAQQREQVVEPRRFTRGAYAQQKALEQQQAFERTQQRQHQRELAQQQEQQLARQHAQEVAQQQAPQRERQRTQQHPPHEADGPGPGSSRQQGLAGGAGGQKGGTSAGASGGRGGGKGYRLQAAGGGRGGRGRWRLLQDQTPPPQQRQRPPCQNTGLCRSLRTEGSPCECDFQERAAADGAAAQQDGSEEWRAEWDQMLEGCGLPAEWQPRAELEEATHRAETAAAEAEATAAQRQRQLTGLRAERLSPELEEALEAALPEERERSGMDIDAPGDSGLGARVGPPAAPTLFTALPTPTEPRPCRGCCVSFLPGEAFRAHAKGSRPGSTCAGASSTAFHPDLAGEQRGTLGSPHAWQCTACLRTCVHKSRHKCQRAGASLAAAAAAGRNRGAGAGAGAPYGGGTPGASQQGGPVRVGPTAACWSWVDGKLDGAEGLAALTFPSQLAFQRSFHRGARRLRQFLACARVVVEKLRAAEAAGDERGVEAAWWLALALPRLLLRQGVGGRGGQGSRGRMGGPSDGRFERFLNGDWQELWAEAVAAEAAAASKRAEAAQRRRREERSEADSTNAAMERRIRRGMRKAGERQYGMALRTLTATAGIRPATEDVRARLQDKHPASGGLSEAEAERYGALAARIVASYKVGAAGPAAAGVQQQLRMHQLHLSTDALQRALVTAPKGSAGGGSGWLLDILRCMGLDGGEEGLALVHSLAEPIAQGRLPARVADALAACTLIGLAKGASDVRPIACGESLHRIAMRALCMQEGDKWCKHLCPMQYSVRAKDGASQLSLALRSLVEKAVAAGEDFQVVKFDIRNAFNEVKRGAVLEQLRQNFPELLPGVCSFYLRPGVLHCRGDDGVVYQLRSRGGVRQGDPIAPFLFALALHSVLWPVQEEFGQHGVYVLAFADDGKLAGPPAATWAAFKMVEARLPGVGLRLSDGADKNVAWSPTGAFAPELLEREAPVKAAAAEAKAAAEAAAAAAAAAGRAPAGAAAAAAAAAAAGLASAN